jgi:hypothetical protein
MTSADQLQLLFALFTVCALLAIPVPLLLERIARRGY